MRKSASLQPQSLGFGDVGIIAGIRWRGKALRLAFLAWLELFALQFTGLAIAGRNILERRRWTAESAA
jgi:hypothetical protein